jgi:hypothetical protein
MTIQEILKDPATSRWLRDALTSALTRDPVDVLNDIDVLKEVWEEVNDQVLLEAKKKVTYSISPSMAKMIGF